MALPSRVCKLVIVVSVSVTLLSCFYIFGRHSQNGKPLEWKQDQIKTNAHRINQKQDQTKTNARSINQKQDQTKTNAHSIAHATEKDIWNDRLHNLQKGCYQSSQKEHYKIKYQQGKPMFFQSTKLNLSVCKVPKAGSTFWTIMFLILEKGMPANEAFEMSRKTIHLSSMHSGFLNRLHHPPLMTKGAVVSRDPYSRLFSAFIDKYYLLRFPRNAKSLAHSLKKGFFMTEAGKCGYDVSFKDFVTHLTTRALLGRGINSHWCPVYILCRVCEVEYQYVLKQETLTRDTEYLIQQLNITNEMKTTLTGKIHGSDASATMEGVIQTMWSAIDTPRMRECCSKLAYFRKMWEGFKIQGYIRTNIPFPVSEFQGNDSVNVVTITKAVLSAMNTRPLSAIERTAQRKRALINAYSTIPRRMIAQIQEMYKMDFYTFGYDVNPPK